MRYTLGTAILLMGLVVIGDRIVYGPAVDIQQAHAETSDGPPAIMMNEQAKPDLGDLEDLEDPKLGTYFPDDQRPRPRPRPRPEPEQTIYARRIVLRGPEAVIILDADPAEGRPGVFVYNRTTWQAAAVYLGEGGRPVVSIRDMGVTWDGKPRPVPVGIFADEHGNGYLQLREGPGTHVLAPRHIRR